MENRINKILVSLVAITALSMITSLQSMNIQVLLARPDGERRALRLEVPENATISQLKEQISQQLDVAVERLHLGYREGSALSRPEITDDAIIAQLGNDGRDLACHVLRDKAEKVEAMTSICIKARTRLINVTIDANTTAGRLKELIFQEAGIAVEKQKLVYAGNRLHDDQQVYTCGSNIHLITEAASEHPDAGGAVKAPKQPDAGEPTTVGLKVRRGRQQDLHFDVKKDAIVAELKEQISGEIGIDVDKQRIVYCGKELSSEEPLGMALSPGGHQMVDLVVRGESPAAQQPADAGGAGAAQGNNPAPAPRQDPAPAGQTEDFSFAKIPTRYIIGGIFAAVAFFALGYSFGGAKKDKPAAKKA